MDALPDRRALAFPDEPFSAYCKVCWQSVYPLWIDKEDHHKGECMFGATKMEDCKQAMDWTRFVGKVRSYVKASKSAPLQELKVRTET